MEKRQEALSVVVTGDMAIDWNLAYMHHVSEGSDIWSVDRAARTCWTRGGSALLADLLEAVAGELQGKEAPAYQIYRQAAPRSAAEICPGDPRYIHTYAIWSQYKYSEKRPLDKEPQVWRVEEFLGLDRPDPSPDSAKQMRVAEDPAEAALIVLDDANLGFRDRSDAWPLAINAMGKDRPWILLKMAKPVAQGPLWEHLHREHADRLIVVTTINDLRLTEVQISRELSWERTAQDVYWELIHNPCVNALSHCAHIVVSFGTAGAILLTREKKEGTISVCTLFYDPKAVEGMWELDYPGGMIGYTSCLTAGIARQLMMDVKNPNIQRGIQSGLSALRTLHMEGYGERGASAAKVELVFPLRRIASVLEQEANQFAVVQVQNPMRFIQHPSDSSDKPLTPGYWTILQDQYSDALDQVAEQIVLDGPETTLKAVPLGQFGNLLTVDRQEIESFRSIRTLVGEYCRQEQQKRPLSIAVFGSPGSGKSFGITEISNSLLPGRIEVREFNLSQFGSTDDLLAALHQVRDIGLGGKIPLIFWDEFDTAFNGETLGWLRYFLAPMQDGRFQEGQISHPIGRSIFVFAGGTATNMAEFGRGLTPEEFHAVKGPDFISRLKGYVNILGPNPIKTIGDEVAEDPYFIIRRAILLRSLLKRNAPQLFEKTRLNIDRGVLRALLRTREYRHGVRSIEAIIAMSQLVGKNAFERSSLPAESQLDLHVDGQNFLALVQQIELVGGVLEALAEAAHDIYRTHFKTDEGSQTPSSRVAYADLPEETKEQNRQNVRDIPIKLASAGYVMIPARSNERPFNFPGKDLERLAVLEHERWMKSKMAAGWSYAPETNDEKKQHKALLPWAELSENEKEKDRELVRGIPRILARGGYAIVKSKQTPRAHEDVTPK